MTCNDSHIFCIIDIVNSDFISEKSVTAKGETCLHRGVMLKNKCKSLLLIKPFHAKGILTNKMFKGILADILIKKNVSQYKT
jgi:hypothetical protein